MISSYYRASYDENKDYSPIEFHAFCYHLTETLRNHYVGTLRVALPELSLLSLNGALVDTYKSNTEDRSRLIKAIIGSFMNFVSVMKDAMNQWRRKEVPEGTLVLLASLFQWMTFEQGIVEMKRWMPTTTSPPVVLFRAVTKMSRADPFITMKNIDYSSTLIRVFPTEDAAARQRRLNEEEGQALNYNIYAIRSYGPESELVDFSFLTKAQGLGAEKVLVSRDNKLELLDLTELYESASRQSVYTPRYVPWSG